MAHFIACGVNDHVEFVLNAIGGANAFFGDAINCIGFQMHMLFLHGGVPIGTDQHALATELEGGRQLFAKLRVFHLAGQVAAGHFLGLGLEHVVLQNQKRCSQFVEPVHTQAVHFHVQRGFAIQCFFSFFNVAVWARHNPVGRALKHHQVFDLVGNGGANLHGRGASANQANTLAFQFNGMVPSGGVYRFAFELLGALEFCNLGCAERAHCCNHIAGLNGFAIGCGDVPQTSLLVEY